MKSRRSFLFSTLIVLATPAANARLCDLLTRVFESRRKPIDTSMSFQLARNLYDRSVSNVFFPHEVAGKWELESFSTNNPRIFHYLPKRLALESVVYQFPPEPWLVKTDHFFTLLHFSNEKLDPRARRLYSTKVYDSLGREDFQIRGGLRSDILILDQNVSMNIGPMKTNPHVILVKFHDGIHEAIAVYRRSDKNFRLYNSQRWQR